MFDWFWNRVLSEKRIGSLMDKLYQQLEARAGDLAKETAIKVLEDEEIAQGVVQYTDALFERYKARFWSSVGGTQRGLNAAMDKEMSLDIMDEEGNISLSKIIGLGVNKLFSGNLGEHRAPLRSIKNPFKVES